MTSRRFPPWTMDEHNDACFIVKDHNGQALAYVYFEHEPGRRTAVASRPHLSLQAWYAKTRWNSRRR